MELSDQQLTTLANTLSRSIRRSTEIDQPFIDKKLEVSVPSTSTLQSPFNVYGPTTIGGQWGARIATISLAVDAVFQTNYYWRFIISGATGTYNDFGPFDSNINTFDIVPMGKFINVKAGANLTVQAYNQTGTANNAIMSVYTVADHLTQKQAASTFTPALAQTPGSGVIGGSIPWIGD
jgi:hypothetical protein